MNFCLFLSLNQNRDKFRRPLQKNMSFCPQGHRDNFPPPLTRERKSVRAVRTSTGSSRGQRRPSPPPGAPLYRGPRSKPVDVHTDNESSKHKPIER